MFVRASGKSMDDGIPGFLTIDGFHRVLLPGLVEAAKSVASESWVLGEKTELDPNGPQMGALERDVITLYEADYIKAWEAMLNDLTVVPLRSLSQAAQDLFILASPQSPMKDLLVSIARQVTLSVPPAGIAAADKAASGDTAAAKSTVDPTPVGRAGFGATRSKRTVATGARGRRTLQGAARSGGQRLGRGDRPGAEIAE